MNVRQLCNSQFKMETNGKDEQFNSTAVQSQVPFSCQAMLKGYLFSGIQFREEDMANRTGLKLGHLLRNKRQLRQEMDSSRCDRCSSIMNSRSLVI